MGTHTVLRGSPQNAVLRVAASRSHALAGHWCPTVPSVGTGHPSAAPWPPWVEGQGGRSATTRRNHSQVRGCGSGALPGGPRPAPGGTGLPEGLTRGDSLPHHDTLSPHRGEPAVPAPPATRTVISAGRAEASAIISGDSSALERRMPRARQDFPAGLVCGAGWHPCVPAAARPCGAWLAPQYRSRAGPGRGCGGEHCHRLCFMLQHAPAPSPPCKRHGCGLVLGHCWHRR